MAQVNSDAVILRNQPVAKEGALEYREGFKLKRWEDLQKNIGRTVPVLDEHPSYDNGNKGLYSGNEKRFGDGVLKQCPNGTKSLCADIKLADGSPVKTGYSIGYPYEEIMESGEINGQHYDSIQANLLVNHIALTNDPRDEAALQIAGDSRFYMVDDKITVGKQINNQDKAEIHLTKIGYDSYRFDAGIPAQRVQDIKTKILQDNPTIPEAELNARANLMVKNEQKLTRVDKMPETPVSKAEKAKEEVSEEPDKSKKDSEDSLTREHLIMENARLKAEKSAHDSAEKSLKDAEAQLKVAKDAADRYKSQLEEHLTKDINHKIETLVRTRGFDAKEFAGKSADFVEGVFYFHDRVSSGVDNAGEPDMTGEDSNAPVMSINDYKWDWDSKKMVLRPEVAAKQKRGGRA
jgi:hypothetical protein